MWNSVTASRVSGSCGFECLFERHGVGAGRVFFAAEGAQAAGGDTDIRGIDVAIDVEVGVIAVQTFANVVGHPSDGENVAGAVEREAVFGGEAFAGKDFGVNRWRRASSVWNGCMFAIANMIAQRALGSLWDAGDQDSRGERRDEDRLGTTSRKQESQRTRSEGARESAETVHAGFADGLGCGQKPGSLCGVGRRSLPRGVLISARHCVPELDWMATGCSGGFGEGCAGVTRDGAPTG